MSFHAKVSSSVYLGSCAEPRYGLGNMLRGTEWRRVENKRDVLELLTLDGEWVTVMEVVEICHDSYATQIHWIDK